MSKIGLVLTGGGARAAYQAGVLRAICEICELDVNPFNVVSGISAGAINVVGIASHGKSFEKTTRSIWASWSSLDMRQVFKTDPFTFLKIGAGWLKDLSFGGRAKHTDINYLLDTTPLSEFIRSKVDFDQIRKNIETKKIHGVALTATHYRSSSSRIFFDGHPSIQPWCRKSHREARRTILHANHVLASSSIPIFFAPVLLEDGFYGDGCIKQAAPLSSVIHMGADRILAIGIHRVYDLRRPEPKLSSQSILPGDIVGTLLNALFFHSIDEDIERFQRINRTLSILTDEQLAREPDQLRKIPILVIKPEEDIGLMASELYSHFPRSVRHLLRGLGSSDLENWDLMSYLAFEKDYIHALLKLGYRDAVAKESEILEFFGDLHALRKTA